MNTGLVKNASFEWNGSGHREYRLVIYPDAVVYEKIMAEKQRFFMNYGIEAGVNSFPYIMVAGFYAGEGMEETLIRWIQRICSQHNSFEVLLNNYSGLPQHSIYLRVQDPQPLQQLATQLKMLDGHVHAMRGNAAERIPHINLAKELPEAVYQKTMPVYSRKTFRARFMATELVLLGRDHPYAASKTITVFRFLPANHKSYSEVA
ncbi:2'-5' RNA ligase family protein [Niastella caeni]|uniref:2'-5' RNA ligase family protein n=1 Tax=Niastella caeni TaxID=2569763 RepID=A0A4S8I4J3_9BACT|nr:2'-5' RNA ligase family protein [Niastella caeni]THU41562.1 2'-5' RNA ligase family protein [Niastella caeni]